MPAARPLKRRASHPATQLEPAPDPSFQLTFASQSSLPADPSSTQPIQCALAIQPTISFAPNITPGTFTEPPPSEDDLLGPDGESSHSTLFPDTSSGDTLLANPPVGKRRRRTTPASASRATPIPSKASSKKSAKSASSKCGSPPPTDSPISVETVNAETPAHIPRPPNAFILFRSSFIRSQHVSAETEGNHGTLSKIVGMLWHSLSYEERQLWQAKARKAYAEHKRKYPGYSFRPVKDKAAGSSSISTSGAAANAFSGKSEREGTPASAADAQAPKRKTRAVGPRDVERCEHIAALLARGLKGAELDTAMKQFDASRAPKAFTARFEAPLTAQAYASSNEKEVKDAAKEVKDEESREESGWDERENTVEVVDEPQSAPIQTGNALQTQAPPALATLRPRRMRRSSSAPLLDAGIPISAPAPLYPTPHSLFLNSEAPLQPLQISQQEHRPGSMFHFAPFGQYEHEPQNNNASYAHMQEGIALRKRSASSSPPLRRPSYSYSYAQAHPQLFSYNFSAPCQQQHQQQEMPQPLPSAHCAAHPHLQQMQVQMQEQVQAHAQAQRHQGTRTQPNNIGLGLEFGSSGYGAGFGQQEQQGGLSRQSTLSDMGSDDGGGSLWNGSVDFSGFSFTDRGTQTPVSAHPSQPGPGPFEASSMSVAPSSAAGDEYDYSDLPLLVEQPLYQDFYQQPARLQPQPQLAIQTAWSGEEFTFNHGPTSAASMPPSSALDVESMPPSAVSGAFEFPPSSALDMESRYLDYPAPPQTATTMNVPTPCSPASQSASGAPSSAGARTPIDDAFASWDPTSPGSGFDGRCSSGASTEAAMAQALETGFRAYIAQARKTGVLKHTEVENAYEQFARFVHTKSQGSGLTVGVSGMGGGAFGGEPQTQMADVM